MELPRNDLVGEARAGDEAAFEEVLRPLIEPALRLACGMLQDPQAAEDAVQEAAGGLIRLASRKAPQYPGDSTPRLTLPLSSKLASSPRATILNTVPTSR
jgi:DNA-directed RNA polymerase specialized sigma24 family protein